MQSITQNNNEAHTLESFIDEVCTDSHLRVEQDFGGGYVRLRSTEAEKRQAAQDIRSTEDIVIEMLRNSRDASAKHIFIGLQREDNIRKIVIIDDGSGIPPEMQARIFEPRVTSKLDSAHMDKWGMHGRGMALYSVSVNANSAYVKKSQEQGGSSIVVETNLIKLKEKTDQSTFPYFEIKDGVHNMRGPKNILRTASEFALEHRNHCMVYCGSFTEIAATLYMYGMSTVSSAARAFSSNIEDFPLIKQLAISADEKEFTRVAESLGLIISERSARRIINGDIDPLSSLLERLENEAINNIPKPKSLKSKHHVRDNRSLKITSEDIQTFKASISHAFSEISEQYYLETTEPEIKITPQSIIITFPVEKLR